MNIALKMLTAAALLAVGTMGTAFAAPLSSCHVAANGGNDCDLYEEDANGAPSEIGWIITLPLTVGSGVVLILEPGGNASDQTTWSDEIIFTNTTVQLISDGCTSGIEGDVSCFLPPAISIFEDANGLAVFNASDHDVYRVHSDGDAVPEPGSALLIGLGLAGLGWVRRRMQ